MKRLLLAAAAIVFTVASATPVAAYEFQCGWRVTSFQSNGCPTGYQDNDSCGCGASASPRWYGGQLIMKAENEGGNGVSAADFTRACRESADAWSAVSCSSFVMDASQTVSANSSARWGSASNNSNSEHGVFWVASENEWMQVTGSGAGGTLGVTVSPFYGGCSGREYVDTDILVNGFVYGGWSYSSVKSVVLHEMGHAFGLGHPCLLGYASGMCSNECQALMGATGGEFTTPQQDDVNGICALYPGTPGGLGASCTGPSDCSTAPVCITYQDFRYCTHTCGTCEEGYECRDVGGQNVCVRKGAPAAGDPCTGVCEPGALCVSTGQDSGQCYTECDPASPVCTGEDRCVELEGGGGICWPPGTQQLGELCGTTGSDDCAAGLVCIWDEGEDPNAIYHCYRECDPAQSASCGSGFLCQELGQPPNTIGICYASAGPDQDCWSTQGVCVEGYECTPVDGGGAEDYTCHRSCDWNNPASCGEGQSCVTFVDENNNPVAGACYPAGDKGEGELCVSGFDCATGLMCITTEGGGAECLLTCNPSAPNCPHAGQECYPLSGSSDGVCFPAGGQAGVDGGTTPRDGGSTGVDSGGVVNPEGRDYLEPCAADAECKWNLCRAIPGRGSVCLIPCDPRVGHYDCPTLDDTGCIPEDVTALNLPGQCQPGVTNGATLGVGATCNQATGYEECTSGLCEGGLCLMACNGGECPPGFTCDTSELANPGVCRPQPEAPFCACTTTVPQPTRSLPLAGAGLLLLGLAILVRRKK